MAFRPLSVQAIYVRDSPESVHAECFLAALSDSEYADLRAEITLARQQGTSVLRCGECGGPVYSPEPAGRRRHCHHFGTELRNCSWATANARHSRSIDAEKFKGRQESKRHKFLKTGLAEILSLDAAAKNAGIFEERYTKGTEKNHAYPDVFTGDWQGHPTAFEIQLSTTQIPVIVRRETFYADNTIRLCWIVGNVDARQLELRAFRDIHLRNDGQILGVDEDILNKSRSEKVPHFRLYRLLPGKPKDGFAPVWKNAIRRFDEIDWGAAGAKPKSVQTNYDGILDHRVESDVILRELREKFYTALADDDYSMPGSIWNETARLVGGRKWDELGPDHDTAKALGALATIRTGRVCVKSKLSPSEPVQLANAMILEPRNRRGWTHALWQVAEKRRVELLKNPKTKEKHDRNERERVESGSARLDFFAGPVFNVFFPEGGFHRLKSRES